MASTDSWTAPKLLILYGSEEGNAQDVAQYVQQLAINRNLVDTRVSALDDFDVSTRLPRCNLVIFIVSTTGDGEAPGNMSNGWRSLLRKSLGKDWLSGVQTAVFGLGDSSYAKFNAVARRLQARLVQLGAQELIQRGLGDDQHEFGYFGALLPWLTSLWEAVLSMHPLPDGFVIDDSPKAVQQVYTVANVSDSDAVQAASSFDPTKDASNFYAPPLHVVNEESGLLVPKLTVNKRLTATDWQQDVRHLEFELPLHAQKRNGEEYRAGDVAVVYPENTSGVDEMLAYVRMEGNTVVSIERVDGSKQQDFPTPCTVQDVFQKFLDILGTPRRSFFSQLSTFATDEEEKEKLEEIASPEGVDLLYDYCIREKRTYAEVLSDFPSAKLSLAMILQLVPRLKPRQYSIASSSLLYPHQVHLSVAIVDFLTRYKRRRKGIASSYFEQLSTETTYVPMWLKHGVFQPPDIDESILMVGPGTGLASPRAIALERKVLRTTSPHPGNTYLFFGCRHQDKDFLYGQELLAMENAGDLTRFYPAFSRDQSHKVYVQTKLVEAKEEVCQHILNGGYIYIAGSAKRMPNDVFEALRDILRAEAKLSLKDADNLLKKMQRTKRYVVESWS